MLRLIIGAVGVMLLITLLIGVEKDRRGKDDGLESNLFTFLTFAMIVLSIAHLFID